MIGDLPGTSARCEACGTDIARGVLVCPGCQRFVHAGALASVKRDAENAAAAGDRAREIDAWRTAASLVPPESRQYAVISARIDALVRTGPSDIVAPPVPTTGIWKWLGSLGVVGVLLWKFKFLIVLVLGKGKLLLLGLTKIGTIASALLAFGVYWTAFGAWFALGFILSIYVHEMGHIAALRRFGIQATAPMFVPGLGAFIRMRGRHLAAYENARVGLAGPMWGLGAAVAAYVASRLGGGPLWAAVAHTGAWINLFNLLPVWQLDGNRGFSALTKLHRAIVTGAFVVAWALTHDGLAMLLAIVSGVRTFDKQAPAEPDQGVLAEFVFLILALSAMFVLAR